MHRVFVLMSILFIALPSFAQKPQLGGNVVGNAGDACVSEFKEIALDILDQFQHHQLRAKDINLNDLENAISTTVVSSKEQLFLWNPSIGQEIEVDAINFYPKKAWIEINRDRWYQNTSRNAKYSLVLHEYLDMMGLPDQDYKISSRYFYHRSPRPSEMPFIW